MWYTRLASTRANGRPRCRYSVIAKIIEEPRASADINRSRSRVHGSMCRAASLLTLRRVLNVERLEARVLLVLLLLLAVNVEPHVHAWVSDVEGRREERAHLPLRGGQRLVDLEND